MFLIRFVRDCGQTSLIIKIPVMDNFQIQVSYRGKCRQFYTPCEAESEWDYSSLVENIVTNISSLFGTVFQIQFLNDEQEWITPSENSCDMRDMFRCARIVPGADFRRIKIKIIDGCSPAQQTMASRYDEETGHDDMNRRKKPKRLEFQDYLASYKHPIDVDIGNKKDELESLEAKLLNYEEEYERTAHKYSGGSTRPTAKSGKQCGKCHLFQNHRKNTCPNDICVSAIMCGDIQKHHEESCELREIAERKNKASIDVKKIKQELDLKIKVKEKLNCSFEKRLEPHLIESNRKRYLADTAFGIRPRQALLNEDIAILERHYRGIFPSDIEYEKQNFQQIITRANTALPKKPENSARDGMYSVQFPKTASATAPNPMPVNPPLPLEPPPRTPETPLSPLPPYSVEQMMPWTYWYCSPSQTESDRQTQNKGD